MSVFNDNFISPSAYNNLPHILNNADAIVTHQNDLEDLRAILRKHKTPPSICLRLIHKHFDIVDGEAMVFRAIQVPSQGNIVIMGPMNVQQAPPLRGLHYRVNSDGQLQSYEYTTAQAIDVSGYTKFFEEFCKVIVARNLQETWGLKIGGDSNNEGWTEFEIADKRSTVMIRQSVVASKEKHGISVVTEWHAAPDPLGPKCLHCEHPEPDADQTGRRNMNELYLAGEKLEYGSPIYVIVNAAIEAM
jgi:hypothetical protein